MMARAAFPSTTRRDRLTAMGCGMARRVPRPGERFFHGCALAHVEHARQRIGGKKGTDLALDGVPGTPGRGLPAAREGIGPRRSQRA